jgi:hypothetical protein
MEQLKGKLGCLHLFLITRRNRMSDGKISMVEVWFTYFLLQLKNPVLDGKISTAEV